MDTEAVLLNDTTDANMEYKFARLAEMSSEERLRRFLNLNLATRRFMTAGIQLRYPDCSQEEMKKRKAALLIGRDYTIRFYAWDPDKEGY